MLKCQHLLTFNIYKFKRDKLKCLVVILTFISMNNFMLSIKQFYNREAWLSRDRLHVFIYLSICKLSFIKLVKLTLGIVQERSISWVCLGYI